MVAVAASPSGSLWRRCGRRALARAWPHLGRAVASAGAQARLEELLWLALAGMNYCVARSGHHAHSGELWVLEHIWGRMRGDGSRLAVDVGANTGEYAAALLAARPAGAARVLACEPVPATFTALAARLGSHPDATLCPLGLSDAAGERALYVHARDSALASVYPGRLDHLGLATAAAGRARMTTLDALAAEHGLARLHFLKLDVEGHELAVLRGATQLLAAGAIDVIQFEYGAGNIDSRTYLRDFFALLAPRYHLFRVLQRGLCPLPRYRESYEQMLLANYLAVARQRVPAAWAARPGAWPADFV